MHCREICSKYKAKKFTKESRVYERGHKRCSSCDIYIQWDGSNCPCCGHFLRTRPRNTRSKNRLSYNAIFKTFQSKLKLNQETSDYAKKIYFQIMEKATFKYFSPHLIIGICIFIASRFKGEQTSLKEISEVFDAKEVVLELCCEIVLDDIKPTLISTN